MQANLRSVLAQVSRGGGDIGSRRNFGSYLGNIETKKGGRRRRVTRQIKEKIHLFGKSMNYGYCAVMSWAIIQMFEHRRTVEIDLAERYGTKPETSFRDVLGWIRGVESPRLRGDSTGLERLLAFEVTFLADKVQAKEESAACQVPESNQLNPVNMSQFEQTIKTEDRLSSGSAVLDEDAPHQLRDSCDSYIPSIVPIHHSEEDNNNNEGSGNDTGCFADVFAQSESFGFWGWT